MFLLKPSRLKESSDSHKEFDTEELEDDIVFYLSEIAAPVAEILVWTGFCWLPRPDVPE